MLRPPSHQNLYDLYYSGDPALLQPPAGASKAELAAHEKLLQVARETGDWRPLLIEGATPTKFVMRPLSGTLYRRLVDRVLGKRIGAGEMNSLAFRAALSALEAFGDRCVERVEVADYGSLVKQELVDELEAISPLIVTELGDEVLRRARGPSPKS